ncbi:MAG TPA: carboxypeptidase regulatory-like domain-containing protein [Vicinamibacterales bacterium]|nr:carboxypeptidase regulatory-like domain-containing protein [Vicinamibacterales bacterium]
MKIVALAAWLAGIAVLSVGAQPGPTTIRGRVVAEDTDEPLANVRVAAPSSKFGAPVVLTDEEGRFALTVSPGTARLVVSKTGYGARDEALRSTIPAIDIRLQRGAAVSGRVVDESGDPVLGARVSVLRAASAPDDRGVATGTTDDRGEYRLASLAAADYVVVAVTLGGMTSISIGGNQVRVRGTQRAYYPGTSVRGDAQTLALEPGDDRPNIDFVVAGAESDEMFGAIQLGRTARPAAAAPDAAATGIVRGRVVTTDGRPIPRAQVLLSLEHAPRYSVASPSDADGGFEFRDLPAGSYSLRAAKTGYGPVAASDASRAASPNFGLPSIAVTLREGETRERVDITLPRWGTLSGHVLDERGDPLQGARVQVLQMRYDAGRQQLAPAGSPALSDDLGRYRLHSLPPGSYVVTATCGDVLSVDLPGYAASYYPGTPEAREAQLVPVALAQDVVGIDMLLSRTRTARISGQLVNAAGEHALGGSLTLTTSQRSTSLANLPVGARVQPDGQFEFTNVPPGQYIIRSDRGRPNEWTEGEFGTLPVSVDGTDAADLVLHTSLGSRIHGQITFDTKDLSSRPAASSIQIVPTPVDFDLAPHNVARADIHTDWSFDIAGVNGPRRLQLVRAPAGWGLEDVRVTGISVIDRPLAFGRSEQSLRDVEVVLTDRVSELKGTVTDDDKQPVVGSMVVVFSTDRDRWYPGSRFFGVATSAGGGVFTLAGLPFGTYYAAAVARPLAEGEDAWQDQAFLDTILPRASTVVLREDQKQTLDLRVSTR